MARFKINKNKGIEVVEKSVFMLKEKSYPFDNKHVLPDTIIPENIKKGSLEHALLLFCSCSIDSMRPATKVYEAMRNISKEAKLTFLWGYSEGFIEDLVEEYLEKKGGINKPVESLRYASMKLHMKYGDDPRKLRKSNIDETLKELQKFKMIGSGKAALIMKNFVRFGIWKFSKYEIPMKIDRHVIKISVGTGVVEIYDDVIRSDQLVKPLGQLYRDITSEKKISAIDADDAIWGIGSNICFKNDIIYCHGLCNLECKIRPQSDSKATWIHPYKESRKMTKPLSFIRRYNH